MEPELTQQNAGLSRDRDTRPTPGPTKPSPKPPGLGSVLARNIRTMEMRRDREEVTATLEVRVADAITGFTGSMWFVNLHVALFGLWIIVNLGLIPGVPLFDPSFVILAMVASVEAIFLSTFILISQNQMAPPRTNAPISIYKSICSPSTRSQSSSHWCRRSLTGWESRRRSIPRWTS